jgi:osmotically inducible lipoprotein OsmB
MKYKQKPTVRRSIMKSIKQIALTVSLATAALAMTGCSNMSRQDRDTAVGAGVGAVAGSVLTGGSPVGTVAGAAVGGVVGNQASKTH